MAPEKDAIVSVVMCMATFLEVSVETQQGAPETTSISVTIAIAISIRHLWTFQEGTPKVRGQALAGRLLVSAKDERQN